MGERQEKVWVVVRAASAMESGNPVKAFDDRKDARAYAKNKQDRAKTAEYWVVGVKKG